MGFKLLCFLRFFAKTGNLNGISAMSPHFSITVMKGIARGIKSTHVAGYGSGAGGVGDWEGGISWAHEQRKGRGRGRVMKQAETGKKDRTYLPSKGHRSPLCHYTLCHHGHRCFTEGTRGKAENEWHAITHTKKKSHGTYLRCSNIA